MIHLYAEHLLNISTLSVQASLSTVSNKETKATLSADGSILTLTHEGETASITLPINLSPNRPSTVKFTIPAVPSRELNFRVQLEAKDGVFNGVLTKGAPADEGHIVPWTAASLTAEAEVCCKECDTVLVPRHRIQEWKDLPSEGWAEMMDFWHCHKPDEPHGHDHAQSTKGYAAHSQLALRTGVAMVGVLDFLLAPEDCQNIKVLEDTSAPNNPTTCLLCRTCRSIIGQVDSSTQGQQLRKSHLSLSLSPEQPTKALPLEKWFATLLLNAIETQGVRKFTLHEPGQQSTRALKIWIFTPYLSISSSIRSSNDYIRVCKIMWQECAPPSDEAGRLQGLALSEGELLVREGEVKALRGILERSAAVLPEEARTFLEWRVGLLELFAQTDLP